MIDAALVPALFDVLVVARTGSVGAASRQLHKTSSAVSQQIRRIEQAFRVDLFERAGRGLRLSAAGEGALHAVTRLFDEAEATFARLEELAGSSVTVLRVAASDYLGRALLAPAIRELLELGASMRFEIKTTHSAEALRAVERGEVDFAIATGHEGRAGLEQRMLLTQTFVWVGPKRKHDETPLAERLMHEPLLRLSTGSEGRRLLDGYLERRRIVATSTIDVPSVSLMLSYALGGIGVGLVPQLALDGALEKRLALESADVESLPVRLVCRRGFRLTPVMERFVDRVTARGVELDH